MAATAIDIEQAYAFDRGLSNGSNNKTASIVDDFAYRSNVAQANIYVRMGFLRKVYGILTVQLLATTLTAAFLKFTPSIRAYVSQNPWMLSLGLISSLVLLLSLHVYRRKTPINYFLLAAFTFVEAYVIGILVTYFDQWIVLQAFLLTTVITLGLTLYTLQSKKDFSAWGAGLFVALCLLMFGGLIQIFLGSNYLELLLSGGGALVFALFLVYDTHVIMHHLSPEEYILATITLYLDVFNLFLHLLRFLEAMKRN